jgi:hypothetical protein
MLQMPKGFIFFVLLSVLFNYSHAQNLTTSPYSSFGIGDIQFSGSAWMSAMGQTNQGFRSAFILNNQNPASYSAIRLTTWDLGATFSNGTVSSSEASISTNRGSLAYFSLALPVSVKRGLGMSFGLMPYSSVGYNVSRNVQTTTFTGTEEISGKGGLSKAYVGAGIKLSKRWHAGVNASYIFGQINQSLLLVIPRQFNMFNQYTTIDQYAGDFDFDLGVQYHDTFSINLGTSQEKRYAYTFGLTYNPSSQINVYQNKVVRSLGVGVTNTLNSGRDTIKLDNDIRGYYLMPHRLQFGASFQEIDKWIVAADVGYANWSDYRSFGTTDSLKNILSLGLGFSVIPKFDAEKNILNRIEYRAGFKFDNGLARLNNRNISSMIISAGLGIPMARSRSRLNITGEYLLRGTTNDRLVQEEFFRVTVGVLIVDRWFLRYRYD